MAPKISVIMPMYNCEEYVRLAIGTLLEQTFKDFEAILIDDGSTDRTLEIAKSFSDPRIKIIELEKNIGGIEGVGTVRNIGLEHARGEFIYFMDSDDALLPDGLTYMLDAAERSGADVVICLKFFKVEDDGFDSLEQTKMIPSGINARGFVESDLEARIMHGYYDQLPTLVFMHLYRRTLLIDNNIRFDSILIGEDVVFNTQVLCTTPKIFKVDKPFYVYRLRSKSMSHLNEMTIDEFVKRIRSFLRITVALNDIISAAFEREHRKADVFLIDNICALFAQDFYPYHLMRFYKSDPVACNIILDAEIKKMYGNAPALLRVMTTEYFMAELSRLTERYEKLQLRNTMKALKESINKVITF